jgi:hypothetical protein
MKIVRWVLFFLVLPAGVLAQPRGFSLSLGGVAAKGFTSFNLVPDGGFGVCASVEWGLAPPWAAGLDAGLVEYLAPSGQGDMKSAWLDIVGRFFPLADSSLGLPYVRAGLGISPFIPGLFEDYWPNYAAHYGYAGSSSQVNWTGQAALGYRFHLEGAWALDAGARWDIFWADEGTPLQTLGLEARAVLDLK